MFIIKKEHLPVYAEKWTKEFFFLFQTTVYYWKFNPEKHLY